MTQDKNAKNEYSYFRSDRVNNTAVLHFRLTYDMQISLLLIIQTIHVYLKIYFIKYNVVLYNSHISPLFNISSDKLFQILTPTHWISTHWILTVCYCMLVTSDLLLNAEPILAELNHFNDFKYCKLTSI